MAPLYDRPIDGRPGFGFGGMCEALDEDPGPQCFGMERLSVFLAGAGGEEPESKTYEPDDKEYDAPRPMLDPEHHTGQDKYSAKVEIPWGPSRSHAPATTRIP